MHAIVIWVSPAAMVLRGSEVSRPGQSESSTPEVAGVIHVDRTVCRTALSRRSQSRGASAYSAAIASAAVDGMVRPGSAHGWRELPELEAAGVLPPFGQRGVLIAAQAGT
jgi:hypothetical protein